MPLFHLVTYTTDFALQLWLMVLFLYGGDRHLFLRPFTRANFNSDIEEIIHQQVVPTTEEFYNDQDHILNLSTQKAEDQQQLDTVII